MSSEGGSGLYGAFASKLGAGAAKAGKKFAQSEAGRSASRAAIKGATDAAAKDLTDRYFGPPPTAQPQPKAPPRVPPNPGGTAPVATPSPAQTTTDSDEEFEQMKKDAYVDTRPPSKPSIFNRFKPSINLKSSSNEQPKARKPQSKSKVYKYSAINKADWDSLPQAMTLYNFRAEMKCDLEFRKGQVVHVITRTDSQNDWWEGRIEDRVGIFPANYVKLL